MSKGQTLRVLVTERLTAAAEEIFALFEKAIVEFEAELRRSKRNNPRKRIRDSALSLSTTPGPGLNQDPPRVKEEPEEPEPEEPSVRPEGHALLHQYFTRTDPDPEGAALISVGVPESSATCVKTEESPLLPQRQTEPREDTQGGDISAEPHSPSENFYDVDQDEDWRVPLSCSAAQMKTEADGDLRRTPAQTSGLPPKHKSAPETRATVNSGATSGTAEGTEAKKHQCSVCEKRFGSVWFLRRHFRVHTGEKPFSCSKCKKTFSQKCNLDVHLRVHTGEKPYRCSLCTQRFAQSTALIKHKQKHARKNTYSC